MADSPNLLANVPREAVTSEAPRSNLSAGDVAQPYQELSKALDKTGGALSDMAVPLAERAGAQAVTRDADGNIQVAPTPVLFGPAGPAYQRAMKVAALAEADGASKRADLALREQHRDDPQGYLTAADAYTKKAVGDMASVAGPEVGNALKSAIQTTTTQTYKGLLNEKERLDLQRADGSIAAGMKSASDDAMTLARQGVENDNPDLQKSIGKYAALLDERVANPRLAYTRQQADLDLQTFTSELGAQRYLHHVDNTYQAGGFKAAEADARDILDNAGYKLSPEQREAYFHRATGEIRANEAIRRADVGEARAAFSEFKLSAAMGPVTSDDGQKLIDAFNAAKDPGGASAVKSFLIRAPNLDNFSAQPIPAQIDQVKGLPGGARGNNPGNIDDGAFAKSLPGYTGASGRFATFDTVENGAGAMAANLRSYARQGVGSLSELTAKWAPFGDGKNNPVAYANRLSAETGIAPDARIDLADPAIAKKLIPAMAAVEQGHRVAGLDGAPVGADNPAASAWARANRERTLNGNLWDAWKGVMTDYDKEHIRPNLDLVDKISDGAHAVGNAALSDQISHDMANIDLADQQGRKPLGEQEADISRLNAAGASGALSPGQAAVKKDLEARHNAIVSGLQENPMQTAVGVFSDKLKTPDPLDFKNPQTLIPALAQRAQIAQFAAGNWQVEPLSVFDKQDRIQVKAALQSPDPREKAGIYGAIATLPADVRAATLKSIADKEPAGMAEAAAGSMMADQPALAASIFQGQSLMTTDKRNNPEDEGNQSRTQFHADLDKSLPASMFSVQDRSDPAGAWATTAALVKARYAFLTASAGTFNYDGGRLEQAVADVTGGLVSHNGQSLIPPRRGMTQPQFDSVVRGIGDDDLAGVRTLSGTPVTADYLRANGQLESAGDGQYRVRLGRDPLQPVYAYAPNRDAVYGAAPSKFVLDLRGRAGVAAPGLAERISGGAVP